MTVKIMALVGGNSYGLEDGDQRANLYSHLFVFHSSKDILRFCQLEYRVEDWLCVRTALSFSSWPA